MPLQAKSLATPIPPASVPPASMPVGASRLRLLPFIICQLAAVVLMLESEHVGVPMVVYVLTWGLLNCVLLVLLARPALAAALSLALFLTLVWVSRFKAHTIWTTLNFTDVMIIDSETFAFLWEVLPRARTIAIVAIALALPTAIGLWFIDPWRVRRRAAAVAACGCFLAIVAVSFAFPHEDGETFGDYNNVSLFVRSGVEAVPVYLRDGYMESDATVTERLKLTDDQQCLPARKLPHIILLHDEASFDIRAVNGIKVPDGYGEYFKSLDGRTRTMLVEGAGGPSWYTEYNVLTGLSARSFGRFQFFVTRIAAGRVLRGLPRALRHCGYRTISIYPVAGGFLGTRRFYGGIGVDRFLDGKDIRGDAREPDHFYFDTATRLFAKERGSAPLFLHVYLTANHWPYDDVFRPDLTPAGWRDPGNAMPEVNEYLRRQAMTERDYRAFVARLQHEFPGEPFLIVRFGDHQPDFAKLIIDPKIPVEELGRRIMTYDPRYYSSYYAVNAINFQPADLASAGDVLDAPYLPLLILEAAGVPLDPTFAEQKKILQRCRGLFYACGNGAEARRLNRLLIDAGLIKGL